jgi:hypothetical protein
MATRKNAKKAAKKASVKSVSARNEKRRAAYAAAKKRATKKPVAKKRKYTRRAKLEQTNDSSIGIKAVETLLDFADVSKQEETTGNWDTDQKDTMAASVLPGTYLEDALESAYVRAEHRRATYGNATITSASIIDSLYHQGDTNDHTRHNVLLGELTTALARYVSGQQHQDAIRDVVDAALELHAFGLEQHETFGKDPE